MELWCFCPHYGHRQRELSNGGSANGGRDRPEPQQGGQAIRRALTVLRILAAGRETGVPLVGGRSGDRPHPPHRASHRAGADRGRHRRAQRQDRTLRDRPPGAGTGAGAAVALAAAGRGRALSGAGLRTTRRYAVPDGADRARYAVRRAPHRLISDPGAVDRGRRAAAARRLQRGRRHSGRDAGAGRAQDRPRQRGRFMAYRTDLPTVLGQIRPRGAGATICATSAWCRERSRSRPGSGVRTASPRRRSPCLR